MEKGNMGTTIPFGICESCIKMCSTYSIQIGVDSKAYLNGCKKDEMR